MTYTQFFKLRPGAILLAGLISANGYAADDLSGESEEMVVLAPAEEQLKQQPGVSIITAEDIAKDPPVNDLSDIIRKMPGVNLTGNSASGSRGNNRQIDIRGMGPENTLILIDGVPTTSRNSVRYSWRGERDTRGDTNWVPAEMVERIEVLRGPAAARYGSGAAGGVINIITKRPTKDWHGSLSLFTNQPENDKEGATKRTNFSLSGPLAGDALTMRLYGNFNKTDADAADINTAQNGSYAAGNEGVRNKDINALFSWKMTPTQIVDFELGYSRQGNIYAGDTQYSNGNLSPNDLVSSLYGQETNRLYRQTYGVTHNGIWDWGQSRVGVYYEKTNNTRLQEGSTGRVEGMINSDQYNTSRLQNVRTTGEVTLPLDLWLEQTMTLGAEWNREQLNDPASMQVTDASGITIGDISGDPSNRSAKNSADLSALYFEDNIEAVPGTLLIPGLRFDYHSKFGSNWSPSLNASQELGDYFKLKAGIARVFKAPNLYQSSEGYLLSTRGNGCPNNISLGSCYLMGNNDLDPEVSINKEIGLEFAYEEFHAGITYFRNDYKNKIVSGTDLMGYASNGYNILRWENGGKAVVEGLEGSLVIPVVKDRLSWRTNATYMITSENKDTGNPLSVIPKYTVNTMLDYQVTDKLSTNLTWTFYGRQKPREYAEIRNEVGSLATNEVGAYSVAAIGVNYDLAKNLRLNAGISNLFDKQLYRENEGASTYNEPGRAYYAGMTLSF
ncbi:Enterobactin outer-membrane receptor [Serratia quinivorans]|jgi:ferric enterobactin receptor|uniref:TonB-dependent siderophore receptor n=1 Tax=Serratia quinivorans TaxID=137545 RepID=UPI00217A1866|nr:TonB-dependent siderophore receptor [Serratia quinivorans]CAI0728889.1 Enterobactin outer-membrane receptor [Serratia quinivorans]CAI0751829.1 Enterobactin outer-membrane receptor [Serratia quinivorans]CAI0772927.1 Enterobactin outer-membrane receptor [Serratia quinivorans]CAI1542881.1 Enterobactin outer-membrane receptor [Serratia quinivorans]CAI1636234.1 Enterobactin outer-membrane receptor [Serratia quinivorans]